MAPWIPCPHCDEYWCTIHDCHVFECDCPPIEEWESDPYSDDEQPAPERPELPEDPGGQVRG